MTNCKFTSTVSGYTLLEVMMTSAIVAIIIPVLTVVFMSTNSGFGGFEASNSLKQTNQNTVNRIYLRLGRSKRIFQNNTADIAFLNRISLSGSPSLMSGSKLPDVEENGTLAPGATNYYPASFGNSLLLTYNSSSIELPNIAISTGVTSTTTVRIDLYKFGYYYLSPDGAPKFMGKQTYKIIEWESAKYADCQQLLNIPGATKRANTLTALYDSNIRHCWDPSATSVTVAFSSFTKTGSTTIMTTVTTHSIVKEKCNTLTKLTTGLMGKGYQYGISPNTAGWSATDTPKTVPAYATASGDYPAGFEIGIVGASAARKVIVRSVIIARGNMQHTLGDEQTIIASARDIW